MLASSSDNNEVPSRNSSLSSLSDKGRFSNINMITANDYGLSTMDYESPALLKNSSNSARKSGQNCYKSSVSDHERMDIEN